MKLATRSSLIKKKKMRGQNFQSGPSDQLTSMREKLFINFLEGVFVHSTIWAFLLEPSIHHPGASYYCLLYSINSLIFMSVEVLNGTLLQCANKTLRISGDVSKIFSQVPQLTKRQ